MGKRPLPKAHAGARSRATMRPAPLLAALLLLASALPPVSSVAVMPQRLAVVFEEEVPGDLAAFVAPGKVVIAFEGLAAAVVETTSVHAPTLLDRLRTRPDVVAADEERPLEMLYAPNDPRWPEQWAHAAVGLPAAWELGRGGHDVALAFLDSGIDTDHPDLLPNRLAGGAVCPADAVAATSGAISVEDTMGHGTHVAGIAAAAIDNGIGVAGASNSCVTAVRVCVGNCRPSAVAEGLLYAAANDVEVVSMSIGRASFGLAADEILLHRAVQAAWDADVLLVAAAGNEGCAGGTSVIYPARFPEVIAVTNLAAPGTALSSTSSCGPEADLAAPGSGILSTYAGGGYQTLGGTSMAAPLVAGVAGLVRYHDPAANATRVRCILEATADDLGATGLDPSFGHGRLDALEAVEVAKGLRAAAC